MSRGRGILPAAAPPLANSPPPGQTGAGNLQGVPRDWFKYFRFNDKRDPPGETRNALLVVAALIAAVTFQAGLSPPGFSDKSNQPNSNQNQAGQPPASGFNPAVVTSSLAAVFAVFGSHASAYLFLFSNSLGLAASLSIIIYLTVGFPFQRELLISVFAMMFTYGFSVGSILKEEEVKKEEIGYVLLGVAFSLPFLVRWLPTLGKLAWKKCTGKSST